MNPFRYYIIILTLSINPCQLLGTTVNGRLFLTSMTSEFTESYSQLEGIELVFGEGALENYCETENEYIDSEGQKHYIVNYDYYTKFDKIRGFPHSFTVDFCEGVVSKLSYTKNSDCGLSEIDLRMVKELKLKKIPHVVMEISSSNDKWSIVQITGAKIIRQKKDISCIAKIVKVEDNKVQIFYNDTYRSHFFNELVRSNIGITFGFNDNGQWQTQYKSSFKTQIPRVEEKFILYGKIPDKKLLNLISAYHDANPGIKILAIQVIDESTAMVYDGDIESVTKWLKKRVSSIATLEKGQNWEVVNTAVIYSVNNQCLNLPIFFFPLHYSPSEDQINNDINNIDINIHSDEAVAEKIITYVYRLRGVGKNIQYIDEDESNIIKVLVDSYPYRQLLKFTKDGTKWRIIEYSMQ